VAALNGQIMQPLPDPARLPNGEAITATLKRSAAQQYPATPSPRCSGATLKDRSARSTKP
jgi:hypothetical protein